jgi:hypothetical protein
MGRLLRREDFIDTFGLNMTRRIAPEQAPRWEDEPGDYTLEELDILREFDNLIRGSTLDDDSDFKKKLKKLAEIKKRMSKPEKDK